MVGVWLPYQLPGLYSVNLSEPGGRDSGNLAGGTGGSTFSKAPRNLSPSYVAEETLMLSTRPRVPLSHNLNAADPVCARYDVTSSCEWLAYHPLAVANRDEGSNLFQVPEHPVSNDELS